ncbi:MAG: hypothetical protein WC637_15945 [Victivallales bacterium]
MKKILMCIVLLAGFCACSADMLPEPPKGFSWQQLPFVKASFLLPEGWHFKFIPDNKEEKYLYYITKENLDQKGVYETGFEVRVIKGVPNKSKGKLPSVYSAEAVEKTEKKVKFTKKWNDRKGIFKEIGYMYVDNSDENASVTVRRLYISNDSSGTVYILTFEGPAKVWDDLWKAIGEPMLKNISIDETI